MFALYSFVLVQEIVNETLAESLVNFIQSELIANGLFDDTYNNSYLWSIFLSTLGLMFHESVQPIYKVHLWLLFLFLDASLAIRHRNDALRLYGIGGNQRSLIPLACFIVRFRNDVHLQVLIRTFAVSVYVQI